MKKGLWLIILSGILYGTIAPGAKLFLDRSFSFIDISFLRALFVTLILLPFIIAKPRLIFSKRMIPFFVVYGLIGGFLEISMFSALSLGVPIAIVAFFLYSQPVWTIIFGKFLLNEEINSRRIIAVLLGLLGIAVLVKSWEIESTKSILGISLAFFSGILLSLWVIWGRKSAIYNQHYLTTTFAWSLFATIWIFLLFLIIQILLPSKSNSFIISFNLISDYWKDFVSYALVAGVLPHLLFYKGLEDVKASVAGIILLTEPLSAAILATLIFSQKIGFEIILGGFLILLSNYFIINDSK